MSILNCYTRLCIINHTGLPATFTFEPIDTMRIQPVGDAHVDGSIQSTAVTIFQWVQEFWQLISYGPTFTSLEWTVGPNSEESVRFQLNGPLEFVMVWTDPSVSWEDHQPGKWSIDISKVTDVTMHIRGDVGKYVQQSVTGRPAVIKSVQLQHYLEIACDDEIPFSIECKPVSNMYWSPNINLQNIISA